MSDFSTLPWAEQRRQLNANRAAVTKIKRNVFTRMYPVTLVNADGSTTRIKYSVPRILVKLPLDFDSLDENMQRAHHVTNLERIAQGCTYI